MPDQSDTHQPIKDENAAHPISSNWRPTLRAIVKAFTMGDYEIARTIPAVAPVSGAVAQQIRNYVSDYAETLIELPDDTWRTSIAQWMGTHWDVLVDLWTAESGRSDLVLSARVFEVQNGFRIEIDSIHVP